MPVEHIARGECTLVNSLYRLKWMLGRHGCLLFLEGFPSLLGLQGLLNLVVRPGLNGLQGISGLQGTHASKASKDSSTPMHSRHQRSFKASIYKVSMD
jgi:hypothetical protein